jgi:hypothetical protein
LEPEHVIGSNLIYAWQHRRMDHAIRRIGEIVTNEPRRLFTGHELRERTGLRYHLAYRALDSLVDVKWLDEEPVHYQGRNLRGYRITERGKLCFRPILNDSSGDDDIHSGDNPGRQVWGVRCVLNESTNTTWH